MGREGMTGATGAGTGGGMLSKAKEVLVDRPVEAVKVRMGCREGGKMDCGIFTMVNGNIRFELRKWLVGLRWWYVVQGQGGAGGPPCGSCQGENGVQRRREDGLWSMAIFALN